MQKRRSGALVGISFVMSVAAHASLGFLFYNRPAEGDFGTVSEFTNAISINVDATDVTDAIETGEAHAAAAMASGTAEETTPNVEKTKVADDDKEIPATTTSKELPIAEKEQEQTREAEQAEMDRERAIEEGLKKQAYEQAERDETKKREEEAEAKRVKDAELEAEKTEREKHEKQRQAAIAGGIANTGSAEATAQAARVSASQGSILSYGARIRSIINKHIPHDIRKKKLRIAFRVIPEGGISNVDIMQSSQDIHIDGNIQRLVATLAPQFPPPPQNARADQLYFNLEIIFQ